MLFINQQLWIAKCHNPVLWGMSHGYIVYSTTYIRLKTIIISSAVLEMSSKKLRDKKGTFERQILSILCLASLYVKLKIYFFYFIHIFIEINVVNINLTSICLHASYYTFYIIKLLWINWNRLLTVNTLFNNNNNNIKNIVLYSKLYWPHILDSLWN